MFGRPGSVGQLFFTVSEPSKNNGEFNFDYSASAQLLIGHSLTEKFDVSGTGVNTGVGYGAVSASYSTNNVAKPDYHIVGFGPSVGLKFSSQYAGSQTSAYPVYIPFLIGLLLK